MNFCVLFCALFYLLKYFLERILFGTMIISLIFYSVWSQHKSAICFWLFLLYIKDIFLHFKSRLLTLVVWLFFFKIRIHAYMCMSMCISYFAIEFPNSPLKFSPLKIPLLKMKFSHLHAENIYLAVDLNFTYFLFHFLPIC